MLYVGLRAIAKRIGVATWTVQKMANELDLPIMAHPKSKLRGRRLIWCLDEEMYLRWVMAQATMDKRSFKQARAIKLAQSPLPPPSSPWNGPGVKSGHYVGPELAVVEQPDANRPHLWSEKSNWCKGCGKTKIELDANPSQCYPPAEVGKEQVEVEVATPGTEVDVAEHAYEPQKEDTAT